MAEIFAKYGEYIQSILDWVKGILEAIKNAFMPKAPEEETTQAA
ncbi:MAG: hypothetical protein PUC33_04300 [Oscillospiraceae bacterium]|nr:hypothetical protein [Oscillospiraceae bacterium]